MSLVEVSAERAVATLALNRPEARNALSKELCDAIVVALDEIRSNQDFRVVLVKGNGTVFCSGADFAAVSGRDGIEFLPAFERMLEAVARVDLPTIAVLHGAALGGGLQLATVCDFRIAAGDCRIGIPSSKLGILVNFENIQRLVLLAGVARAKEVLMTARTYNGAEAENAGLVNKAVPPRDLDGEAISLANELAALAPLSVQGAKRAIQAMTDHLGALRAKEPDLVAELDQLVAEAYSSADLQEGLTALAEKRPPHFKGR